MAKKRSSYKMKVTPLSGEEDEEVVKVALDNIVKPQKQPRRYFNPEKMKSLVASVKEHGVLEPLLVRPLGMAEYELVAGERRLRAAQEVGLEAVPVVIRQLSDEKALEIALLENLQREELTEIEEIEGILELLEVKLERSKDEVIKLFQQAAHPERNGVDNVVHSSDWQQVEELFAVVGKFTPDSFRSHRLPLLNLPEYIQEALRTSAIEYTKAREIAKIKDEKLEKKLLEKAISEKLSLTEIKKQIQELKGKGKKKEKGASLKSEVMERFQKLKKSQVWVEPKKKKQIERLLGQLDKLLGE